MFLAPTEIQTPAGWKGVAGGAVFSMVIFNIFTQLQRPGSHSNAVHTYTAQGIRAVPPTEEMNRKCHQKQEPLSLHPAL